METLEFKGKTLTGKFISLLTYQRAIAYEGQMSTAETEWVKDVDNTELLNKMGDLWKKYVSLFVEWSGELALDSLTPAEVDVLKDFFVKLVVKVMSKSRVGSETSDTSEPKKE